MSAPRFDGLRRGWPSGCASSTRCTALSAAVAEILSLLGAAPGAKPRSMPPVFHPRAVTGAVALVTGALQLRFGRPLTRPRAKIHRALGRSYVVAACLTCLGGVVVTAAFDIGPIGRIVFTAWVASWLTATTIALRYIRRGKDRPAPPLDDPKLRPGPGVPHLRHSTTGTHRRGTEPFGRLPPRPRVVHGRAHGGLGMAAGMTDRPGMQQRPRRFLRRSKRHLPQAGSRVDGESGWPSGAAGGAGPVGRSGRGGRCS